MVIVVVQLHFIITFSCTVASVTSPWPWSVWSWLSGLGLDTAGLVNIAANNTGNCTEATNYAFHVLCGLEVV